MGAYSHAPEIICMSKRSSIDLLYRALASSTSKESMTMRKTIGDKTKRSLTPCWRVICSESTIHLNSAPKMLTDKLIN